jgi:hypothetical protein
MQTRIAVALLVAFTATSASAQHRTGGRSGGGHSARPSGGHSGGSHSGGGRSFGGRSFGGHVSSGRSAPGSVSARRYSGVPVTRGYSTGARYASGGSGRAYYGGGRAVPRSSVGQPPRSGTQYRHPRAGYGTGSRYGRGYGYGYRSYGYSSRGYYGRSYSRYPYYYGYSPFYGWGSLGLGLGLYLGGGYPYLGGYDAPYYDGGYASDGGYVTDAPYDSGGSARDDDYYDRDDPRDDGRAEAAELRLIVLPDDASVWVDGEFRGVARDLPRLALRPGRHQLEVVRPGFRTEAREVEVRANASVSVRIDLTRP